MGCWSTHWGWQNGMLIHPLRMTKWDVDPPIEDNKMECWSTHWGWQNGMLIHPLRMKKWDVDPPIEDKTWVLFHTVRIQGCSLKSEDKGKFIPKLGSQMDVHSEDVHSEVHMTGFLTQRSRSGLTIPLSKHSVEPIRKRAHMQLVGEHSVTVVSARWVTVDWFWRKRVQLVYASKSLSLYIYI